ncbi:YlzJ-like family protein [Desulfitibacter alkalitolerans]|uniref:YlzJ-like family protein n=1 Tax=Desulfitibacter alkalitolerans TaxID=264641 RepID=UPI000481DED9|nr:YlzJ-like family protein [Desulfitibacter alkalitolerans]
MVIYTPLLMEEVLRDYDKIKDLKEINYQGRRLQVEMLDNGQYRIARILSSSPQDFLDPKLQPGTILQNGVLE